MNIGEILEQIEKTGLTDEVKEQLKAAFTEAVNVSVKEKVDLAVEAASKQVDEDHTKKLEQLLEAIDEDHSKKLLAVVEKLDKQHAGMLQQVIENYQKILEQDAKEFKDQLIEQISQYLELYLKEVVPIDEIKEAAGNVRAKKLLEDIKKIVVIDDALHDATIAEALKDGKASIDNLKKQLTEAVQANVQLNQSLKSTQTELLLEQKTVQFPDNKKEYIMRVLKGKDPDYVEENFTFVVEMFQKDEEDKAQLLQEEATKKTQSMSGKVDTPQKAEVIEESTEQEPQMTGYLSALKRQDRI